MQGNIFKKLIALVFALSKKYYWESKYDEYRKKYDIHPTFKFNGDGILMYGDGQITIGAGGHIGRFSQIQSISGCKVSVGSNCWISHFVKIYTQGRGARTGNVAIGNNCWICANVFIREGVDIGDNSIVGANSVVTKNVLSNTVVAGCPIRVIERNVKR